MKRFDIKSISIFIFIFTLIFVNFSASLTSIFISSKEENNIRISAEIPGESQWIKNPNFTTQDYWFIESAGDDTDVNGIISGEQANCDIIGEKWLFSNVSGVPNSSYWTPGKESQISIFPDIYEFTPYGLNATHEYWEGDPLLDNIYGVPRNQSRNNPIIHWNRIINMPFDMKDYTITSVNLSAIFNASADRNIETPFEPIEGEPTTGYAAEYDHVRFSVFFSDLNKLEVYEVAYNQTVDLGIGYFIRDGREGRDDVSTVGNTFMKVVDKDELKFYLTRVLSHDYQNFRITLGIDIYNEDNYASGERDTWYYLLIKSCNFSFNYKKNIDRFTSISWKQNCDKVSSLSEHPVIVQNATLNFKYKINELWNTSLSPNSEIRILINDNKYGEAVALSTATTSYQTAKVGGFDVKDLITDDVNLSIQVYLADDFILDHNITVSIDDVSLHLSYVIIEPDEPIQKGQDLSWLVYLLIAAIGSIVIVFSLYQTHFKYPPTVRKIRKLKRKVRREKKLKPIGLSNRDDLLISTIQYKTRTIEYEQPLLKKPEESKALEKTKIQQREGIIDKNTKLYEGDDFNE